jgi:SAM-dependent methyltransferase
MGRIASLAFTSLAITLCSAPALAQAPAAQPAAQPVAQPVAQPAADPPRVDRSQRVRSALEILRREASKMQPLVQGEDMRRLVLATSWLPMPDPITLYIRSEPRTVLSADEHAALPQADRAAFTERTFDSNFFYFTRYGSPLANLRPLQIAHDAFAAQAQREADANPQEGRKPTLNQFRSKSILDFGFGSVAHLRLLASIGCFVQGIEVDPILEKLYQRDTIVGEVPPSGIDDRKPGPGFLNLSFGSWPSDPKVRKQVQGDLDLFVSKNTLKRGYIIPPTDREYDPKRMINLGVPREEFLREVARVLKPNGLFLIYNISPAQSPPDKPYIPWADGRSPFEREMLEAAGFEVLAFDQDDAPKMREFAQALGWHEGENAMDLEKDFVVLYTLARKR